MGTPAPIPSPVIVLAMKRWWRLEACQVRSQPSVRGRQSSRIAIRRPNLGGTLYKILILFVPLLVTNRIKVGHMEGPGITMVGGKNSYKLNLL